MQVFTDEDAITLLENLTNFEARGRNKMAEFHQFIKDRLSKPDFTRIQVSEKVRSLKGKFKTNWERAHVPDDPHKSALYKLSKSLWEKEMNQERGKRCEDEMNEESSKMNKEIDMNQDSGKRMKKRKQDAVNKKSGKRMKKRKQNKIPTLDEFQYAYPNLYASFHMFGFPKIAKENCNLIEREDAKKFEHQWKELNARLHCLKQERLASQPNQQQ